MKKWITLSLERAIRIQIEDCDLHMQKKVIV